MVAGVRTSANVSVDSTSRGFRPAVLRHRSFVHISVEDCCGGLPRLSSVATTGPPGCPARSRLTTRASTSADRKSAILDAVHDAAKGMHKAGVTDLVTLPQLRSWNF